MTTLRQLRYLVAIADTLNFRRAADLCHVTQPTLSDQIKELEARLKVQLIERSRRRVVLTPIGRDITDRARGVLRDVQDIIDLAERGRDVLEGVVRLGVLPSLGPYLLPLVLPSVRRRHPHLTLYLREDTAPHLLRRLEEGDLDLVVFPLPVRRDAVVSLSLFREPLWLAFPKDHALAAKAAIEPHDLHGLTVLALEPGHSLHADVLTLCREFGARPLLDFATTSLDTLRQMAAMGVGATFLPALYVRAEARGDPNLAVRPFVPPGPDRHIGLIWRGQSARRSEYVALGGLVREVLAAEVPEVAVGN